MALRSFSLSMVTIFIPIYLYKIGFGFSNILLFYVFLYFFELILEYPAAMFVRRMGPKHSMVASLPFLIIHIWQLFTLSSYHWTPIVLALTISVSLALFWEGYHYDFSRSKHTAKATKEVGKLYIILTLAGASAPLIGGAIATFFSFQSVLFIIMVLLTLGSIVLFRTKDTNFRKGRLNFKNLSIKNISRDLLSYGGLGWETLSTMTIWPLFLFIIIGSYFKLGLLASLTIIVTIFTTYWVSLRADKNKRIHYIKTGGFLGAIIGMAQIFVETITQAFAINLGRSFAQSIFKPTYDSEYYLHADEQSRSEYIFLMESVVDLSRLIFYFLLFCLSFYFSMNTILIIGLIMGAIGSAFVPLMPPAKCEICGPLRNKAIRVSRRPEKTLRSELGA